MEEMLELTAKLMVIDYSTSDKTAEKIWNEYIKIDMCNNDLKSEKYKDIIATGRPMVDEAMELLRTKKAKEQPEDIKFLVNKIKEVLEALETYAIKKGEN